MYISKNIVSKSISILGFLALLGMLNNQSILTNKIQNSNLNDSFEVVFEVDGSSAKDMTA